MTLSRILSRIHLIQEYLAVTYLCLIDYMLILKVFNKFIYVGETIDCVRWPSADSQAGLFPCTVCGCPANW